MTSQITHLSPCDFFFEREEFENEILQCNSTMHNSEYEMSRATRS